MKTKILVAIMLNGLFASQLLIASPNKNTCPTLSWWSDSPDEIMSAAPPPKNQPQWYLKIKVYDKCENAPCGDIHINNCLMLSTLSAGQEAMCQFADDSKPVTWNAVGNKSAGEVEYTQ